MDVEAGAADLSTILLFPPLRQLAEAEGTHVAIMIVNIKVIPNAPTTELRGTMADGTLKVAVHAAREDGKANEELVRFLAAHFHCSRDQVRIVRGSTASRKAVEIKV